MLLMEKRKLLEMIEQDVMDELLGFSEPKGGQLKMFSEIWDERPRFSEISGARLVKKGGFMWHAQFLHILPKGSYPKMKLFKPNIMLATFEEHNKQESFPEFKRRKEILTRIYHKFFYNKQF